MASLTLHRGISHRNVASYENVLIAGQLSDKQLVHSLPHDTLSARLSPVVEPALLHQALAGIGDEPTAIPLYLNRVQLLSIPSSHSRGNTPSNSIAFSALLKKAIGGVCKKSTCLSIILITSYEHAMAHLSTVARAFPLYSRKTSHSELAEVHVEFHFIDEEKVTDNDFHALKRLAESIRSTAQLVDAPANELNVDELVREAVAVAHRFGIEPLVIRGQELRRLGFGGIYNVGKAAMQEPAFVCLSHMPTAATKSFALVGKGILYDTGGLSMKTKLTMPGWKCDMAGAAAALHSFATLVACGFSEQLHVLLCMAENAVSPVANKPDDVITLLSGKTVEINNTDAEGRLVLADGVFYANSVLKASTIIDIATLTVAQGSASGRHHAAIMSNCECFENHARKCGLSSGDLCHPMQYVPDLHMSDYSSQVADFKNSNMGTPMGAPSEIAGLFIAAQMDLSHTQWLHVDMGTLAMVDDRATAYGVPLLTSLLGEHTNAQILSGRKDK